MNFYKFAMKLSMQIPKEILTKNLFTLLTAPVAKGKTYSILNLYENIQCLLVFVSPLRALADEIFQKQKDKKNTYYVHDKGEELKVCWEKFLSKEKGFFIFTFETLPDELLDSIQFLDRKILFVIDEFHLIYLWKTFRPIMHEKLLGMLNSSMPLIGLSATMNEINLKELCWDLSFHQNEFAFLNFGNQELFYLPHKVHCFDGFDKQMMFRNFILNLKRKRPGEVFLMFAEFRSEVDQWVELTRRLGFKSMGCVGGEVMKFTTELSSSIEGKKKLDCIISTSTLSHGVNLPEITKVFIAYKVKQEDFWLQMVGRGGRSGKKYEVYTFDQSKLNAKLNPLNKIKFWIFDWVGVPI